MAPLRRTTPGKRRLIRLAVAVAAPAAVALVAAMPPATGGPREDDTGAGAARGSNAAGVQMLRQEIDAMVEAGMSPDDPKVQLLEEDLAELVAGATVTPPPEPGVHLSDANTRDVDVDRGDAQLWDQGQVPCEPLPPDLLTAAEIAGATCRHEAGRDGSGRYVATRPDGTEIVVVFDADGTITRVP